MIPGVLIGLVLMGVNYFTTKTKHYGNKHSFDFKRLLATLAAIIYSVIIGVFVYHELDLKSIYEALRDTVLINGQTTFLVGISMAFARFLTMSQVPNTLASSILNLSNPIVIMLAINCFLLVVGCFIDNISSTVILTLFCCPSLWASV